MFNAPHRVDVGSGFVGGVLRKYVANGQIANITSLLESENWSEIFPVGIRNMASFNGQRYFVPQAFQLNPIWYRKDLFEEHGLKPPETWEQLLALCDRVREMGLVPFAVAVEDWPPPAVRWFTILNLRLNGADFHQELMKGQHSFNHPRVANVFSYLKKLVEHRAFADDVRQKN